MLPLKRFSLPRDHGTFGAVRKHDIHTGIDLYCNPDSHVFAIEAGTVMRKGPFTGPNANLPWWNDTDYLTIKGKSGYILYGEIISDINIGELVKEGQHIGNVKTVLKENRGLPMTMLHLELYTMDIEPIIWDIGKERPDYLLDPMPIITKGLWKHYTESHKVHEVVSIPEGEWFTISGRGRVMTVDLRNLDASIKLLVGDNVKIGDKLFAISGIEYSGTLGFGPAKYAGLVLREIIEEV
jgi:hypothetical protein